MRRMHIGLKVDDIEASIAFYTRLFGAEPTLERTDYAKWMLDDPCVNFSIDLHGEGPSGSAHYGIQLDDAAELSSVRAHLDHQELPRSDQDDLVCGYQLQHKSWVHDPHGVAWEMFFTEGVVEDGGYGCEDMPETGC